MTLSREEIEQLLPFLANDTLEGEERDAVEAAVADDPELATELQALRAIRETMQAQEVESSPGEFGLARLMRDVAKEELPTIEAANTVVRPRIWQIAAAFLMAVVIGQGVLLSGLDQQGDSYQLAGAGEAVLTVAFLPDVTEAALRNVLLDAGVEIVSGPSALGLYGLDLLEGVTLEEAEAALPAATEVAESVDRAQ